MISVTLCFKIEIKSIFISLLKQIAKNAELQTYSANKFKNKIKLIYSSFKNETNLASIFIKNMP